MKKQIITALLAISMVASLTACGKEKEDSAESAESVTAASNVSTKDYNPDDYVSLGEYEGIEVVTDVYTFTDADVENQINDEIEYYVEYNDAYEYTVTDKQEVENGDLVNIDYIGKKDGVAFDGGTATGSHLEIGSNSFIDGFETGLIGHKVGEDVSLNLTFPDNYQNEELAGAAVVFDVKINSIDTRTVPELTDALVQNLGMGFETVDEYREDVRSYLQETCDENNESEKQSAVWDAVYATCTVKEPPQALVDDVYNRIMENAKQYAQYYGTTVEEFIQNNLGMTQEEFESESRESAEEEAKQKLAVAAIAKKAGITLSDDDVTAAAEAEYADYGYESADDLLSEIGAGPYYDYILRQKVDEYLATVVTIKENAPVSMFASETEEVKEEELEEEIEDGENIEEIDADLESEGSDDAAEAEDGEDTADHGDDTAEDAENAADDAENTEAE